MKLVTKLLHKYYMHSHCCYKLSNHTSCHVWLIC